MDIAFEIVDLIRRNRISTTEVADALGKRGSILGVNPINSLKYAVGRIRLITPVDDSNYLLHREIQNIEPGEILFVKPQNFSEVAVFGDLVAKYVLLYRQAAAIVVDGNIRDTSRLVREGYAIWCRGSNPVGAINSSTRVESEYPSSHGAQGIAVCDEGGVVIISETECNAKTLARLRYIEALEDMWQYCLNTLKWSTFDIVVQKRYLIDTKDIPPELLKAIREAENE
ncbi:MenG Demethylmenaquinone methyltransferase [Candidatus Nanopelagicaceae bacterium]